MSKQLHNTQDFCYLDLFLSCSGFFYLFDQYVIAVNSIFHLSSQNMLQLHIQFVTLWDWFVKSAVHPKVYERHATPGSPTCTCRGSDSRVQAPALATQKKFVVLSTSHQPTDHCQSWAVIEINNFCCYCTLALTVGPKRSESCAWPCHRPFFGAPPQSSAWPWRQIWAASAQQFCKLSISPSISVSLRWIEVIKAGANPCVDVLGGRRERGWISLAWTWW